MRNWVLLSPSDKIYITNSSIIGNQKVPESGRDGLEYGVSITDACIHWDDTVSVLQTLADAVKERRKIVSSNGTA